MLENIVINYSDLERYLKKTLKKQYFSSYVFDNIESQIYEKVTSNGLQDGDMITGIELCSHWTVADQTQLFDFINIEKLELNNDSLLIKVSF